MIGNTGKIMISRTLLLGRSRSKIRWLQIWQRDGRVTRQGRLLITGKMLAVLYGASYCSIAQRSLYAPFVERTMSLFSEAGLDLQPYSLADETLLQAEGTSGAGARAQPVRLSVHAYRTGSGIRQARIAHIEGGPALQVLNFCIFPDVDCQPSLPTFAADLVTLPGGHLIALDYAPNGHDLASDAAYAPGSALATAFARHRASLPDGGSIPESASRFFSPFFLWSRLPTGDESDALIASAVLPAFEDYLRGYLQLVADSSSSGSGGGGPQPEERLRIACDAQLAYSRYRADEDPARPMLSRLFGEDFAERLIREVLFDLPLRLEKEQA